MKKIKNSIRTKIQIVRKWPEKQISKIPEKRRKQMSLVWSITTAIFLFSLLGIRFAQARKKIEAGSGSDPGEIITREINGTYCTTRSNQLEAIPLYQNPGDTLPISQIPETRPVQALEESTLEEVKWMKIDYCGISGWLPSDQVTLLSEEEIFIKEKTLVFVNAGTEKGIKAYVEPSTDSQPVKEGIPYGAEFRIKELKEGWARVDLEGKSGWINMFFMSSYPVKTWQVATLFNSKGINLREKPDYDYHVNAKVPEGTFLIMDEFHQGWGHTSYEGVTGWINLRYLSPIKE